MASSKVTIKDIIKKADVLLEVVDARFPDETRNCEVESDLVLLKKPFIIVLNKCDIVSKETLEKTRFRLSKIAPTVFVSARDRFGTTILRHRILETACIKGRDIMVGVLGCPNTGKSSVINSVAGRHKASTSPISGYTKGVQIVNADSHIVFIDTPGVIPFDEKDEYVQGLLGVKDATHLQDPVGVALRIIEKICAENKTVLESFYHVIIKEGEDSFRVLELIGERCNFIKKKGEVDERRAAVKLINDWQNGMLIV